MYRTTTARKHNIILRIVSASVVVGLGSDFYDTILLLFTMQSIPTKTRLLGYYSRVYTVRIYCIVYYIIIAVNKSRRRACAPWKCTIICGRHRHAVQLSRDAFTLRCCSATTLDMPYYNTCAVQDNSRRRPTPCCPLSDTSDMPRNPITIVYCVTGGETNEKKNEKKI